MAGVDHAYQYSVEVKSRFSLFLDDPLSNEDPDILQNRIQNQRAERKKKDKPVGVDEPRIVDSPPQSEAKPDDTASKGKNLTAPKPKATPAPVSQSVVSQKEAVNEVVGKSPEEHHEPMAPRGRGMPRGFARGSRSRGQGPRPAFNGGSPQAGDLQPQGREVHFEPRGRGRGRGGFSRGRGAAYTDYREHDRQQGSEHMGSRSGFHGADSRFTEQIQETEGSAQPPAPESGDSELVETKGENHEDLPNGEGEPAEEEPKSYTLEEYKAMRSTAKPSVTLSSKGTRKANDGKDVFANMIAHRKINEESDEEVEEVEREPEEESPFEIIVSFTDRFSERGRGSYAGRGGADRARGTPGFRGTGGRPRGARARGGGFRGAGRGRGFVRGMGFENQSAPPPIYSDQDFPSLK